MAPVYVPGTEPLPPGVTEEDRAEIAKIAKWNKIANGAMESCPTKCALSGAAGFGLGAFFSLMSTSFAVDDPLRRTTLAANGLATSAAGGGGADMTTMQSTKEFFKQTGKSMYRSGKGFGKVGALYSGIECCIEAVSSTESPHVQARRRGRAHSYGPNEKHTDTPHTLSHEYGLGRTSDGRMKT